jgi:hypothetical protein
MVMDVRTPAAIFFAPVPAVVSPRDADGRGIGVDKRAPDLPTFSSGDGEQDKRGPDVPTLRPRAPSQVVGSFLAGDTDKAG